MYELVQVGERTYYIDCPSKIGIYRLDDERVCLIDSGNDKDAGKKVLKVLAGKGWRPEMILNTHSHADHIGGNRVIQERTGCRAYCPGLDRAFAKDTVLEPSFLYGGSPYKELRNKFLLAQPSMVEELTEGILPEGIRMVRIDGHSFSMAAFGTEDGIWFVADGVTGGTIMQKYHISFMYDVEEFLRSLDKLEKLEGRLFIPSHGETYTDMGTVVKANREKVYEIADLLRGVCREKVGTEDIIQKVFDKYGLGMDENQYVLVGATLRSYLSWMKAQGEMETVFWGNRLYWHTLDGKKTGEDTCNPVEKCPTAAACGTMEAVNQDREGKLNDIDCFALDMDGTIYLGEQWIEGAKEFLEEIQRVGKKYVFLTNNSSKSPEVYVEKLSRMGLETGVDRIITSGQATISYLLRNYPGKKVFLLGNDLLKAQFEKEGIMLDDEKPQAIVTAFDTTLDYGKLCKACDFVRQGLPYIATHPDYNCPTESGFIPDIGAIHAFIHASTGRYPDCIIGKPNGAIIDYLMERVSVERERTAMVGDRLYTDIAAGKNNGLTGILVLSGEATLDDVRESEIKPDLIFHSVKEMIPYLQR